jgi:hypothetical protein
MSTNYEKVEKCKEINLKRLGETKTNNQGEIMFIVEFNSQNDIKVQFKSTNEIVKTNYGNFLSGSVKSHFTPSVYGAGIVGLAEKYDKNLKPLIAYKRWTDMIERCYSERCKTKQPAYRDVTCCEEWLFYPNFKKWYEENYYEIEGQRMQLDKDILHKGNKIYSPENCIIVPQCINNLLLKREKCRGNLPLGVTYNKNTNKYSVYLNYNNDNKFSSTYNTPEDAFYLGYKPNREKFIKQIADEYREQIPNKLYEALYNYKVEITD